MSRSYNCSLDSALSCAFANGKADKTRNMFKLILIAAAVVAATCAPAPEPLPGPGPAPLPGPGPLSPFASPYSPYSPYSPLVYPSPYARLYPYYPGSYPAVPTVPYYNGYGRWIQPGSAYLY